MEAAEDKLQHRNQIPDGGDQDDDESNATEMAGEGQEEDDSEWNTIIDNLWNEYDKDNSGYLDKEEIIPLAQAALAQVGFSQQLDENLIGAFFAEIDSDGNGKVDREELRRFMKSLV